MKVVPYQVHGKQPRIAFPDNFPGSVKLPFEVPAPDAHEPEQNRAGIVRIHEMGEKPMVPVQILALFPLRIFLAIGVDMLEGIVKVPHGLRLQKDNQDGFPFRVENAKAICNGSQSKPPRPAISAIFGPH